MIKAVIFDLYETLVTEWVSDKYTSAKCAAELGVNGVFFREIWGSKHLESDTGKTTYERTLRLICAAAKVAPSDELIETCIRRRVESKAECFAAIDERVPRMLADLKDAGFLLGMISNCSPDEVTALKTSPIYRYFDKIILSYEAGVTKPDARIYRICLDELDVNANECVYVGDGGSRELYGAESVGMTPVRAMWYLNKYSKNIATMPFTEGTPPMRYSI